jgi:hypothetical protein
MLTIKNALLRVHVDGTHVLSTWRNGDFIFLNHVQQTIGMFQRATRFLAALEEQWTPCMEDAWRKASNGDQLAALSFGINAELVRFAIYAAEDLNHYHRITVTFRNQEQPFYTCYREMPTFTELFPKAYQVADVGRGWSHYCTACDYVWSPACQANSTYACPRCEAAESLQREATLPDLAAYYRQQDREKARANALDETETLAKECQPW